MDSIRLGTVVIDTNYNIVDFNDIAVRAIPNMCEGQKCYEAFVQKQSPCIFCPVMQKGKTNEKWSNSLSESTMEVALGNAEKQYVVSFVVDKTNTKPSLSCMKYNLSAYHTDNRILMEKSEIDPVTGLYNLSAFAFHANKLLQEKPDESFDIFITKIRNYQFITTAYGEEKTRLLLQSLAKFLKQRSIGGFVGRYSVDHFVGIVTTPSMPRRVQFMKDKKEFLKALPIKDVSLSFGVYRNVDRKYSISNMCSKALLAVDSITDYRKSTARFTDESSQNKMKVQTFEAAFNNAVAKKEFQVWYQPKYDCFTERIVGAEALVRWQTKAGIISPGDFLPVFDADGLIADLDLYVFRQVCAQQQQWLAKGRELFPVSVNISRNTLFSYSVVNKYKAILSEYNLNPQYVPIEITESVALENLKIKPIADAFISAGFFLHMDDFGSGRSCLSGLNMLNFDTVKLDKSLVDYIGEENGDLILDHAIALGRELGIVLVAEGVETDAQLQFLKNKGCEVIQGFYYSKPLPIDQFEAKLAQNGYESLASFKKKLLITKNFRFNANHLLERMPGGFFCYDASGEERILFSNSYLWNMFGFTNEADFMDHVNGSFKGIVCPDELEAVEASITQQIDADDASMDFVKYHIVHRDGRRIPIVDYGHLAQRKDSTVFYVFVHEDF